MTARGRGMVIAAAALLAGIALTPFLAGAERRLDDLRLRLRRDRGWPPDLVMVSFDATRPADLPPLVEKLHALGAKTMALDLFAPRASVDALVAAPWMKLRPGAAGGPAAAARLQPCLVPARPPGAAAWAAQAFFAPETGCAFGHSIAPLDGDGIARSTVPLAPIEGDAGSLPSLPLIALLHQRDLPLSAVTMDGSRMVIAGHAPLPLDHGRLALDLVPASHPPLLAAGDVDARVAGALVVLHATGDRVPSPLGAETPGGLLFAFAVRTMDLGHVPCRVPAALAWAIATLLAAGIALGGRHRIAAGASLAAWIALAIALVPAADLFLPVLGPACAFLLAGAAVEAAGRRSRPAPATR